MIVAGSDLTIDMTILENGAACDLTDATIVIRHKDPDGVIGDWSATIISATDGTVRYLFPKASNTKTGEYAVWAIVTFLDTTVLITGARVFWIYAEGSIGD